MNEEPVLTSKPRMHYDCLRCPAYCCAYDRIDVTERDVVRLARHFGISPDEARLRFTKLHTGTRVLRHRKDDVYKSVCNFLSPETRNCTVYEARPKVCRTYPEAKRCGYYEFLRWERRHQGDPAFVPTF